MRRVLTIVLPIIIGIAIIGFFLYGLVQRPDLVGGVDVSTPVVMDSDTQSDPIEVPTEEPTEESSEESKQEPAEEPIEYGYEIVETYPHDPKAFLQGLVWVDDMWYEGTGLYGESTLRKVNPQTGEVIKQIAIDDALFGEGITIFGDKIYQLTWKAKRGFIYDKESFELLDEFTYPTEGWGITHDGERLIMSDGTPTIYFWNPATLEEIGSISVTKQGEPVGNLNELEYIDGLIYANQWQTPFIHIINPETGVVEGSITIERDDLLTPADIDGPIDVLNGIAYDAATDRLFVTGKLWPKIFEIKLITD